MILVFDELQFIIMYFEVHTRNGALDRSALVGCQPSRQLSTLMSLINVTVLLVFWAFLPPGTVLITDGTIVKVRYFGARYVWSCVILRTGCDPLTPVYMN